MSIGLVFDKINDNTMQRITRIALVSEAQRRNAEHVSRYPEVMALLQPHLSARTLSIFAQPRIEGDHIAWYSSLEGQPTPFAALNDEQQLQVQRVLDTRLQDITHQVAQLKQNSVFTEVELQLLTPWLAIFTNTARQVMVINGDPVVLNSLDDAPQIIPPVPPAPPVAPVVRATLFQRGWKYLLLLLLLLLLLGAVLYYYFCYLNQNEVVTPPSVVSTPVVPEPVSPAPEPLQPVPPVPELEPEPEPAVPEPEVKNDPPPDVKSEVKPVDKPEAKPVTKPVTKPEVVKTTPTKNCVIAKSPVNDPPKLVIIFDNSYSMHLTLAEPPSVIAQYLSLDGRQMSRAEMSRWDQRMMRLPSRLSTSKEVALASIDQFAKSIDIGLVALSRCPTATRSTFYPSAVRNLLKQKISNLNPLEQDSGTPLYSGLQMASNMLDGRNRDDFILLLSDGQDSCTNSNICSLANNIAQQKPRIKINVVDIGGLHTLDCVAKATGGSIFVANNQKELVNQINKAISDMQISKTVCE